MSTIIQFVFITEVKQETSKWLYQGIDCKTTQQYKNFEHSKMDTYLLLSILIIYPTKYST